MAGAAVAILRAATEPEVSLPPVRATELATAARTGGCELRVIGPGEYTRPPTQGTTRLHAADPGVYKKPLPDGALIAAMRRGMIVFHYRPDIDPAVRDRLAKLQQALPAATIVVPDASGMRYAIAVTAYRRLLGCPALDERTVDAMRLFRGRYVGNGPEPAPPPAA